MTSRARIRAYGTCGALVVLGVAGAIAFSGTLGQVLAFVLVSLGLVLATALVFYEVGLSEDRELERERARREAKKVVGAGRPRRRLERVRGRPRRLG